MTLIKTFGKIIATLFILLIGLAIIIGSWNIIPDYNEKLANLEALKESQRFVFVELESEYEWVENEEQVRQYTLFFSHTLNGEVERSDSKTSYVPDDFSRVKLFYLADQPEMHSLEPSYTLQAHLDERAMIYSGSILGMLFSLIIGAGVIFSMWSKDDTDDRSDEEKAEHAKRMEGYRAEVAAKNAAKAAAKKQVEQRDSVGEAAE